MRELALIAVGILAVTAAPASAQDIDKTPNILVSGRGEIETDPDQATILYTLRGEGATSDDALRAMVAQGKRIESAIYAIDPAAVPRTNSVSTDDVKSDSCKEQSYGGKQLSTGACAVLGYVTTQSIYVQTSKIDKAGTLVGLASREGAVDSRIGGFALNDRTAARTAALAAAARDAANKAQAVAAANRVTLGPILSVSTSATGDGPQDLVVTGSRIAPPPPPPPAPVEVAMKPTKLTTAVDITVRYAIQR